MVLASRVEGPKVVIELRVRPLGSAVSLRICNRLWALACSLIPFLSILGRPGDSGALAMRLGLWLWFHDFISPLMEIPIMIPVNIVPIIIINTQVLDTISHLQHPNNDLLFLPNPLFRRADVGIYPWPCL